MQTISHSASAAVPVAATMQSDEDGLSSLLGMVGIHATADEISGWSDWKKDKAYDWAGAALLHAQVGSPMMARPAFLNQYIGD